MLILVTKEKFAEEFEELVRRDVDAIDAILNILNKYGLTEDQAPRFMSEKIMQHLRKEAENLHYIEKEEALTLDDFC